MNYLINYENVASSQHVSPVVKRVAKKIMSSTYITPQQFFASLGDDEIHGLSEMVEDMKTNNDSLKDLTLLSMMLSSAEGVDLETDEQHADAIKSLAVWIICVGLERRGLAKVRYENMSFSEEFENAIIVENIS